MVQNRGKEKRMTQSNLNVFVYMYVLMNLLFLLGSAYSGYTG